MSFNRNWTVKATRKPFRCEGCCKLIEIGSPVTKWCGMTDGGFYTATFHVECRAAEIAWNDLHGTYADEWQSLAHNRERDDDEWLIEQHPIVAARLGIVPHNHTGATHD